ncbi:MAG: PAS domain S-box protein [Chloroflexi bacterium]|jgi:PAS domain S-box-containing protein|nr:PAS domain S-box protein [Chloroflexota bacterium]
MLEIKTPDDEHIANLIRRLSDTQAALEAALAGQVDAILVDQDQPASHTPPLETRVCGQVDAVVDPDSGQTHLLPHAQGALWNREARLRMLLQQMPTITWTTDENLHCTSAMGAGLTMLGELSPEQIENWLLDQEVIPDQEHPILVAHRRALAGESVSFETKANGRVFQCHVEPLRDASQTIVGCIGVGLDISERVRAEEELRQAHAELEDRVQQRTVELARANALLRAEIVERQRVEAERERLLRQVQEERARLQAVLQQLPAGVIIVDAATNQVVLSNQQVDAIWRAPDAPGDSKDIWQTLKGFYPDGACYTPQDWPLARSLRDGTVVCDEEIQILRGDGSYGTVLASSAPICNDQGSIIAAVATFHDITERKAAQEALQRARDALERRVAERTAELTRANVALRQAADSLEAANLQFLALARVGQKVQETFFADDLVKTVVEELHKLDSHSAILLWEGDSLVLRHTSLEPELLVGLEGLAGRKLLDSPLHISAEMLEEWHEEEAARLLRKPWQYLAQVLEIEPSPTLRGLLDMAGMGDLIAAPLVARDKTLGVLAIWARTLQESDVPAVTVFANQLAIAIENGRMFETIQVQHVQLRTLSARLANAEEIQRRALAHELHDQLGQNLSALGISLSILKTQLGPTLPEPAKERLDDSLAMLQQMTDHVRGLMADLRPPVLDDYGLVAALRWHGERFSLRTGIRVTVVGDEPNPRLDDAAEISLFRIAQEALINVAKHAQASAVRVAVEADGPVTRLVIADDGVGFDMSQVSAKKQQHGWGLIGMQERTQALGGRWLIDSAPGQGTRIVVEIG